MDLSVEKRNGDFVRGLIRAGRVTACHDLSDGGLAVALAEMAMKGDRGATITLDGVTAHVALFAEDQARYAITVPAGTSAVILADAASAGVPVVHLGAVGGDALHLGSAGSISIETLRTAHEGWFPGFMGGEFV